MNDRKTIPENRADSLSRVDRSAVRRLRRIWFILGAVLFGLLPLVMIEVGLRLFNVGRPSDHASNFAGFNRNFPLFERHGDVYRTSRSHEPFIARQEFPVAKPRDGFRIFCFGGSTVYGHPYLAATAFPKWLEVELAGSDPSRAWQVINCGGISYASYRIAPLVQETLQYQPDLIIVAVGHNEFLEDRTYKDLKPRSALWSWFQAKAYSMHLVGLGRSLIARTKTAAHRGVEADDSDAPLTPTVSTRLDFVSGYASYRRDDAWHQRVLAQYDDSVRKTVASCQAARVPILLVRLGSNLRDCPPFKSEHRAVLAPEREADWQAAFDIATAAEKIDLARALQFYLEAAAIDGEYALVNFRIGRTLDRMGRTTEARSYYEKARDEDICPLRISSRFEECLRRISAETRVPLVDVASVLAARSPDGIPGNDRYVDHVHPNIGGHQLIARALTEQMRNSGFLAKSAAWSESKRVETYARRLAEPGPAYFADGKRRVGWLENWARRNRLAAEMIPKDAGGYTRLGFLRIELGDDDAASAAFGEALKQDANAVNTLLARRAEEFVAEGRAERAAALLRSVN